MQHTLKKIFHPIKSSATSYIKYFKLINSIPLNFEIIYKQYTLIIFDKYNRIFLKTLYKINNKSFYIYIKLFLANFINFLLFFLILKNLKFIFCFFMIDIFLHSDYFLLNEFSMKLQ